MGRKWAVPCDLCKGKSKHPCVMCGWSKPKKKWFPFKPKISKEEELERMNLRNSVDFLERLSMGVWKFSQTSVQSIDAENKPMSPGPEALAVDRRILDHRKWVEEFVLRPHRMGVDIKSIADDTTLTETQVKMLVQNALKREKLSVQI